MTEKSNWERHTWLELYEKVSEHTNPANISPISLAHVIIEGDDVLVGVISLRASISNLRSNFKDVDPDDIEVGKAHQQMIEQSFAGTIERLDRVEEQIIRDYATYLERLQSCQCEECRKGKAAMN